MKLSTSWLKEWLRRTMSDEQIVEALERAGLEVEQFISSKPIDKNVVVGVIKKVVQHPKADRLHLVVVENGQGEVDIVCGAPNVRVGMHTALAQVGSVLPGGEEIKPAKLRGEVSNGMLCSAYELGLGDDHDGIIELPGELKAGTPLCDIYPADGIVDLKTHANRFDLLSVVGLAREVAAVTNELIKPLPQAPVIQQSEGLVAEKLEQVGRFMLVKATVRNLSPSPDWMVARLRAAGVRAISPLVDVTNYVNLEMGQPLHAYDARKVTLPLTVRMANDGEKLQTLDGVERALSGEDLVVADEAGAVGLAGVMGGAKTEVDEATTEILLEAATFQPVTVRKMAKRHGLRTEASARFERGLSVELPPLAMGRTIELLQQMGEVEIMAATDRLIHATETRSIELPMEFLNRLLGIALPVEEAAEALRRLELPVRVQDETLVVPSLPWWRSDLKEAQDLIEEVVRVIGHEQIPAKIPVWRPRAISFDRIRPRQRLLQRLMYGAGLFEVMTYSFVSQEQIEELGLRLTNHLKLKNPLSSEQAYLRSSLLPSHVMVLGRNRTYAKDYGFYELSRVFVKRGDGDQPEEPWRLAVTMVAPQEAYRRLKGILDLIGRELEQPVMVRPVASRPGFAPHRSAELVLGEVVIGSIGVLDPTLLRKHKVTTEAAFMELDVEAVLGAMRPRQFAGVNRFPHIVRDIAVLVPVETTWSEVETALLDQEHVRVSFVSDYYGSELPAGRKSLALRLTIAYPDRTPTEQEATVAEETMLAVLRKRFEAELRS